MPSTSLRTKLISLVGPLAIAAALVTFLLATEERRATSAPGFGSVTDVAEAERRVTVARAALEDESIAAAHASGLQTRATSAAPDLAGAARAWQEAASTTDAAVRSVREFLESRDLAPLPDELRASIQALGRRTDEVAAVRGGPRPSGDGATDLLAPYGEADEALRATTAGLAANLQDGPTARRLTRLAAVAEVTARIAHERALLTYAFAGRRLEAREYRALATATVERRALEDTLPRSAVTGAGDAWTAARGVAPARAADALAAQALTTSDQTLAFERDTFLPAARASVAALHEAEAELVRDATREADAAVATARRSRLTATAVLLASVVLGALLAYGVAGRLAHDLRVLTRATDSAANEQIVQVGDDASCAEVETFARTLARMVSGAADREAEAAHTLAEARRALASRIADIAEGRAVTAAILASTDDGLAVVGRDGALGHERSPSFDLAFGPGLTEGSDFAAALADGDDALRRRLGSAWGQIVSGGLPTELALEQFPSSFARGARAFTLHVRPLTDATPGRFAVLVTRDVTEARAANTDLARQRESLGVFRRILADKEGFAEFASEMSKILDRLDAQDVDPHTLLPVVHTIRGAAAQWSVVSMASLAEVIEARVVVDDGLISAADVRSLRDAWRDVGERFRPLLGEPSERIVLTRDELRAVMAEIGARRPHGELLRRVKELTHESVAVRFERLGAEAARLASRAGKPPPRVILESNGVHMPASLFASFWLSTVHIVRNLVDHGLETEAERLAAGKAPEGTIRLRATAARDRFRIEFIDDGRGIDWEKVAEQARAAGLPSKSRADLERALFTRGLSTADEVSDLSGRGVGLCSVEERCLALGGTIRVVSNPGDGARFVVEFPRRGNEESMRPGPATRPSAAPASAAPASLPPLSAGPASLQLAGHAAMRVGVTSATAAASTTTARGRGVW